MTFNQAEFDLRCEWGTQGIQQLAPSSDVLIIVDVLSFSTCIDIATRQGAIVFPYPWRDRSAATFAQSVGAVLAGKRGDRGYSLSPASLTEIPAETRLVLPSPNGSTLSLATGAVPTLAGCLRNCRAVAQMAMRYGKTIGIVPAGEQWNDGSLRPAFEDLIGAGAIIHHLAGRRSPEAQAAAAAFQSIQPHLSDSLHQCGSGQELIKRGFAQDVAIAAALNVSDCVPQRVDRAYVRITGPIAGPLTCPHYWPPQSRQ